MDADSRAALARLLRGERIAHLATLRQGAPMSSMTLYLPDEGFTAFHVHVSRLAWHTQDMAQDPRVALSIAETDDGRADPFTLMRVSIRGEVIQIQNGNSESENLENAGLPGFPNKPSTSNSRISPSGASCRATRASSPALVASITCPAPNSLRYRARLSR